MAKYNTENRQKLADKGHAMPDGSFPIQDEEDLHSAVRNWVLGKNPTAAKRHIVRRANAMGMHEKLPENWKSSIHHSNDTDEFLAHFGVKGMRWGKSKTPEQRVASENAHPNRLGPAYVKSAFTGKIGDHTLTPYQRFSRGATTVYVAAGIAGASYVAVKYGPKTVNTLKLVNSAAKSYEARKGAKFATKALGDLGKNLPYAKIVKGAYKITSLK